MNEFQHENLSNQTNFQESRALEDICFNLEQGTFNFRVGIALFSGTKVLIQIINEKGECALPGGRVKLNESAEDAIIREVNEELGFTIKNPQLTWTAESFFTIADTEYHEIGFYFTKQVYQELLSNKLSIQNSQNLNQFCWIEENQLQELVLYPNFLSNELFCHSSQSKHFIIKSN